MSKIAIEIGSYSIKAVACGVVDGRTVKRYIEIPSWCAHEEHDNIDKYYIGNNAKLWRQQGLAFPIYIKEKPDEYFRGVVKEIVQYVSAWTERQFQSSTISGLHFITPMYYRQNDPKTEEMEIAAKASGIKSIHFTPSHIALCKRQAYVQNGCCILIYDWGHRGLTLSLLQRSGSEYAPIASSEVHNDCAGMKIDSSLINSMTHDFGNDITSMILLENIAKQIKEEMTIRKGYQCPLPNTEKVFEIRQTEFNDLVSPIFSKTLTSTKNFVDKVDKGIAQILICGGSAQIPFVKDRLNHFFHELSPAASITDCTLMENMHHLQCEGCFLMKNDIQIIF